MSDIDWDLLFRYLGRECTPDESARVERWISADARHRAILESARVAADRVLAAAPVHLTSPRFTMACGDQRRSSWAVAAAACLIAVFGATLIWRTLGPVDRANRAPVMRTIATHEGERDTLRLDDGTRVVLGAASTLRYPATFGNGPREVYLVGEGYFEVSHDSRRPFRVHAGSAIAEDLGTAFDMRAYAGDSAVRVVVTEGKVALGAATSGVVQGAILEPGQLGRLTKGKTVPSVQRVDVATYLGWMQGRLAFDDAPLGDVVTELARWYRMEFRIVDSSVATRRLSGSFTNTSLPELLGTLAPVLDVRFERIGDTVLVRRSRSSP